MSLSNSRLAYSDCYKLLDDALDQPRGIRVEVESLNKATYLRMRIHHARIINRADNARTYPDPEHPLHDRSLYDVLVVRIEDGSPTWVYLDKQKVELGRIEPIEDRAQIEPPEPMLQLEGPKTEPEVVELSLVDQPRNLQPQIRRR